jgi:hypothetical protein
MNIDDPKLTAFALDELDEPGRSAVAREVAESPEAQRYVDKTREIVRALKNEFGNELQPLAATRRNLIAMDEERWFWSEARPLAFAAVVAVLAIIGAILFGNYKSQPNLASTNPIDRTEIQAEETGENYPADVQPKEIPNPLRHDVIQRIDRVVIGELPADQHLENGELRLIEIINDAYRVDRLKECLKIPAVSRKSYRGVAGRGYEMLFLDRAGRVIASAHFYRAPNSQFVLQPRKRAYERNGRYFIGGENVLPGDWQSGIDYDSYDIGFPDWKECVGYSPGA